MKRRDFFTKLGLGAVAAVAAPSIVKAVRPESSTTTPSISSTTIPSTPPEWAKEYRMYPSTWSTSYVTTTKQTKISADQDFVDKIHIYVDYQLRMYDVVYLPPTHTNKEIPVAFVVTGVFSPLEGGCLIQPIDLTTKLVRSMRKGTMLFLGPNLHIEHNHSKDS